MHLQAIGGTVFIRQTYKDGPRNEIIKIFTMAVEK